MNFEAIPYIFGEYFYARRESFGTESEGETLFSNNHVRVYGNNQSRFIQKCTQGNITYIFHGKIFSPFFVPEINHSISKVSGISKDPLIADGNFVLMTIDQNTELPFLKFYNNKFGSRIILYLKLPDRVVFSTHLDGIKKLLKPSDLLNYNGDVIFYFYFFGHTPQDTTLLDGLKKIKAGSFLSIRGSEINQESYFDVLDYFEPDVNIKNEDFYAREINRVMDKVIETRTSGSDLFACTISGGVDSGYIVSKILGLGKKVIGYNLAYDDFYNEHGRIEEFALTNKIELNKVVLDIDQFLPLIEECNSVSSEPMGFNDIAMHFLCRKIVSDGFHEIFDGDGADRLFFGMNRQLLYYRFFKFYNVINFLKLSPLVKLLLKTNSSKEYNKLLILLNNLDNNIYPYPERKIDASLTYNLELEQKIYELSAKKFLDKYFLKFQKFDLINFFTYMSLNMCPEMFFHPTFEMQNCLSSQPVSPYWSDELVRLVINIPVEYKVKDHHTKYILRRAAFLNDNSDYWFLPKIGLQNSYSFLYNSQPGKEWAENIKKEIAGSELFYFLKLMLKSDNLDLTRLINLHLWTKSNFKDLHISI